MTTTTTTTGILRPATGTVGPGPVQAGGGGRPLAALLALPVPA